MTDALGPDDIKKMRLDRLLSKQERTEEPQEHTNTGEQQLEVGKLLAELPIQTNKEEMRTKVQDYFHGDHTLGLSLAEALKRFQPGNSRVYQNDLDCLIYTYRESRTEYTTAVWRSGKDEYNVIENYEFLD